VIRLLTGFSVGLVMAGCASVAEYKPLDNPDYFLIDRNIQILDTIIRGGEYQESAIIDGKPAYHNTQGASVVGISGTSIASHVYLNDSGEVCFSTWSSVPFCSDYRPKLYKK